MYEQREFKNRTGEPSSDITENFKHTMLNDGYWVYPRSRKLIIYADDFADRQTYEDICKALNVKSGFANQIEIVYVATKIK